MGYYNQIYEWEGDTTQPYPTNFKWRTKKILLPIRTTFSAARIIAEVGDRQDYYDSVANRDAIIARNNARISGNDIGGAIGEDAIGTLEVNGDLLEDVPTIGDYSGAFNLTMKLYVDEVLRFTKEVYASDIPFRLADGFRGRTFEVEIEGNVTVRRFDMGGSMEELKILDVG